jgi:hypothetical protein
MIIGRSVRAVGELKKIFEKNENIDTKVIFSRVRGGGSFQVE